MRQESQIEIPEKKIQYCSPHWSPRLQNTSRQMELHCVIQLYVVLPISSVLLVTMREQEATVTDSNELSTFNKQRNIPAFG